MPTIDRVTNLDAGITLSMRLRAALVATAHATELGTRQLSEPAPILSATSLGRRAPGNGRWLLREVGAELRAGEKVSLSGPSGSGKSLLLRALALLDPIDAGEVRFRGEAIGGADVPGFRSRVISLHQRAPLGEGTVDEALRQPFDWRVHASKRFDRDRIVEWLAEIGRGPEFLDLHLKNLSVGESQIAALLRAMQLDPDVLLLDEPTSGLDPGSSGLVETLIAHWRNENPNQRAFVWVSHDPAQAQRIADVAWRMKDGRLTTSEADS